VALASINLPNAWKQQQFDRRPPGQSVAESLAQMHASRDHVRRIAAAMTDADLAEPAWFQVGPFRGWRPAQVPLGFSLVHTWGHLEEARVRLDHLEAMVGDEVTHALLDLSVSVLGVILDAGRARELDFSFAVDITDPGGGTWVFEATEHGWQVNEGDPSAADLILSQDLNVCIKARYFITDIVSLIEAGDIRPKSQGGMSVFSQLLMMPDFDSEVPAIPEAG
jgi:hypothetical protein